MPLGDASAERVLSSTIPVRNRLHRTSKCRVRDEMSQRVRACRGAQIESILISTRPAVPSLPIRVRHFVHVQTNGRERRGPLPSSPLATWESWLSLQDDGDGDRATDSRRQLRFYGEISRLMSIDGGERCRLPSPARLSSTESCPSKWQYNRAE